MEYSTLVENLSYDQLVYDGVVPNILSTELSIPNKRFPAWVYRDAKTDPDTYSKLDKEILAALFGQERTKSDKFFDELTCFDVLFANYEITTGETFLREEITCSPDLLSTAWFANLLTTSTFQKDVKKAALRLLAAYAFIKPEREEITTIGLLLPIQRQMVWFDIGEWDTGAFLTRLLLEADWLRDDAAIRTGQLEVAITADSVIRPNVFGSISVQFRSPFVGWHISKTGLGKFPTGRSPTQIFLGSPQVYNELYLNDAVRMRSLIDEATPLFIHASYLINLGNRDNEWDKRRTSQELQMGRAMRALGVTIHVGNYKKSDQREATRIMEEQIREILEDASEETPLLLETPAGEGTEMFSSIESMAEFYSRFEGDPRFKVTIDSAHVHGMGYDPAWFLYEWLGRFPNSVGLVHFNDSAVCRGSRVDRHHRAGLGHVGYRRMENLHCLCLANRIPMVIE